MRSKSLPSLVSASLLTASAFFSSWAMAVPLKSSVCLALLRHVSGESYLPSVQQVYVDEAVGHLAKFRKRHSGPIAHPGIHEVQATRPDASVASRIRGIEEWHSGLGDGKNLDPNRKTFGVTLKGKKAIEGFLSSVKDTEENIRGQGLADVAGVAAATTIVATAMSIRTNGDMSMDVSQFLVVLAPYGGTLLAGLMKNHDSRFSKALNQTHSQLKGSQGGEASPSMVYFSLNHKVNDEDAKIFQDQVGSKEYEIDTLDEDYAQPASTSVSSVERDLNQHFWQIHKYHKLLSSKRHHIYVDYLFEKANEEGEPQLTVVVRTIPNKPNFTNPNPGWKEALEEQREKLFSPQPQAVPVPGR